VAILAAISALGIGLTGIAVVAGALSVGIGFGLQNIVNNFISGLILLYERPIQMGDTVQVKDVTGEVRRIGIRSSTLRTMQGAEVIVPNATLISDQVVNWTLSDRNRLVELPVRVAPDSDPDRVTAILLAAARASREVREDPPPLALLRGFGADALSFELHVWTGLDTQSAVHGDLARAVYDALREAKIELR
jgi:small-conductance mechanosensitive channel